MKKILKSTIPTVLALCMTLSAMPVFAVSTTSPVSKATFASKNPAPRSHQYIALSDLNVREKPSNSGKIIGWLSKGDVVWFSVEDEGVSGWTKVYGNNSNGVFVHGYVASRYIENIN